MDNDQIKRLTRLLVWSWMLVLILVIGIVAFFSYQTRYLKDLALASNHATVVNGINGQNGKNGLNGVNGIGVAGSNGNNGADGQSVTSDQLVAAVNATLPTLLDAYMQSHPVASIQGDKGDAGIPAPVLQQQLTGTCQLQTKYSTDDSWTTLLQLPPVLCLTDGGT
jgi:hypothetical protein